MKNTLLLIGAFLTLWSAKAQFTVETDNGAPILDGDVFAFGQTGTPAKLPFYINNTSSGAINMRVEFVSAINADGSQMQLCITPKCYYSITLGESYPQEQGAMSLPLGPGDQSGYGNYFMNLAAGHGGDILDYVFKFYQVDNAGTEIGTPLTFTYRYDPALSTEEMNKLDIAVYPTLVQDILTVETSEILNMAIYDLQGRLIKNAELPIGQNQIELSNLLGQMYLVCFENGLGQAQVTKIIVD